MSPYKKPPCYKDGKHCDKRTMGCHSSCKEYIEWERNRQQKLEDIRKQKELRRRLDDTDFKRCVNSNSKRRRKY